jgi:hypothetical protein
MGTAKWAHDDPNWTDDLVAQVPHGFDPRRSGPDDSGLFVVPMEAWKKNSDVGFCFDDIQIGHYRDPEGYLSTWIDCIDCGDEEYYYEYTATTNRHPIYFTLETYSYAIIPEVCHDMFYYTPEALLDIYYGNKNPWESWLDYQHMPIMVENYDVGQKFEILASYNWRGNPR